MAEGRKDKDEWFIGNGAKLVGWFQPQKKKIGLINTVLCYLGLHSCLDW